jgi:hypothetical protein
MKLPGLLPGELDLSAFPLAAPESMAQALPVIEYQSGDSSAII